MENRNVKGDWVELKKGGINNSPTTSRPDLGSLGQGTSNQSNASNSTISSSGSKKPSK